MLLVHRLLENQEINEQLPLLVVGAGAGGATAAIEASRQGVDTVLIDQYRAPFMTIAAGRMRHIDPTQYDWPLDHWGELKFPWADTHTKMPLDFHANTGDVLANLWTKALFDATSSAGV
jgi:2-polyprenyl-6-methoxyphenol hydroxylase-like FAD-dependent oxidoreductase